MEYASNSATDIIERLLREGKITAGEAMVLLEKMVNQNNSPYLPTYPTYPSYPIIYECPSSTPPQRFYCTTTGTAQA